MSRTTPQPLAVGLDRDNLAEGLFTADRIRKRVTPDWIGLPRGHKDEWLAKADVILAQSPPAEGESVSGLWTEDMEWERRWGDYERGFRDGQKGIVAVDFVNNALANLKRFSGPDPGALIDAAKDDLTSALKSTPILALAAPADGWKCLSNAEQKAQKPGDPPAVHANASTPALAICAALLRASAAEGAG